MTRDTGLRKQSSPFVVRLYTRAIGNFKRKLKKETMRSEVADESVVVSKPRPMKAGNSLEEKTEVTDSRVCRGLRLPKAPQLAKGGSHTKVLDVRRQIFLQSQARKRERRSGNR